MAFILALGVTPQLLKAKADEVQGTVIEMGKSFQKLSDAILETEGFWKGDAGTLYRKNYADIQNEVEQIMARMQSYPERIFRMAGIYEAAEEQNEGMASSLGGELNLR